ncbi:MAG: hypothetical protein QOH26_1269 [Actinomycetota bacterium]|jgi:AcrR family transcriptional regulator|nr:hypothetical protein [Actinomycetota bacterium]
MKADPGSEAKSPPLQPGILRPRELPSTAKGVATEEALYEAAVQLFFERGYHGTTLRQIAAAIDKQMATLYYYFESKQSILQMIMHTAMDDLVSGLERELDQMQGGTPVERLRAAIRYHVRFHGQRTKEAFVGDSEIRALDDDFLPEVLRKRRHYQDLFEEIVRDGQSTGDFSAADCTLAAIGILQMCTGVATWYKPGGRLTLEEIAGNYAEMVVHGLTTRD